MMSANNQERKKLFYNNYYLHTILRKKIINISSLQFIIKEQL